MEEARQYPAVRYYWLPVFLFTLAALSFWQCWRGHRTGKMWALDPTGSAFGADRQDGCLFVVGWWTTLFTALAATVLGGLFIWKS